MTRARHDERCVRRAMRRAAAASSVRNECIIRGPACAPLTRMRSILAQYFFFGGIDLRTCLRSRATAAAFFRLRSVVGFS
ncbi:hypothetical protein [Burkholderia pseudomallei]|uniref:hypothetical protein n=1 Tax=Burkholderia pseudomallei TaxID=28450 RepID=UPI00016B0F6C|nr:hypothetical protein [Burkholderia pseudomallei]